MVNNNLSLLSVFLIIFLTISCTEKSVECNERSLRSISFDFESSLGDWVTLGGNIEARYAEAEISSEVAKSGINSVKFSVSPDSYVNKGVRAELTFDQMIEPGDETFYEYSLFIPADYQDVKSLNADNGKPNWQIFGQWHDQPDECIGESWDDFPGNSPPIALYYSYLTKSDPEYLKILSGPEFYDIYGSDSTWNDVSIMALEYGGRTIALQRIDKGEWIDFKFHIKWSRNNNGFIQAWVNDNAFTDGRVFGSNMLNNASHYFKFGLYRNPTIPYANVVYYDDVAIY